MSMAFSEGLSDTGEVTGRGNPCVRAAITGGGTLHRGVFHTVPFLISGFRPATSRRSWSLPSSCSCSPWRWAVQSSPRSGLGTAAS